MLCELSSSQSRVSQRETRCSTATAHLVTFQPYYCRGDCVASVDYMIDKRLPYLGDAEQKTTKSTEVQRIPLSKTFGQVEVVTKIQKLKYGVRLNQTEVVEQAIGLFWILFSFSRSRESGFKFSRANRSVSLSLENNLQKQCSFRSIISEFATNRIQSIGC